MPAQNADDIARIVNAIPDVQARLDVRRLRAYLEELLRWNPQLSLVSKRETPAVVAGVIRRSVEMWDAVDGYVRGRSREAPSDIVDIGSGAGFPGLVWKLLAPSVRVTLVERKSRRAFFLERLVAVLDLTSVAVLCTDLNEMARDPSVREAFDLAAMLAVAPPERLATATERILKPGGLFVTTLAGREAAPRVVEPSFHRTGTAPLSDTTLAIYEKRQRLA
jgi:16S rRNA (guanine527-N7)-methyltransferase